MAHRRSGEIPPPFSPLRRRNGQRRLADTGVFGSGKRLGPVVAYITIRMADRSKTSAPTYPPVTSFTHTHTHTRARVSLAAYTRSRTPSRLSTCTLDHALRRSPRFQRSNPSLVYSFQPPSSSSRAMEPTVERMFRGSEWKKGSCSMLEISAGGSETVGNWKEGKGWMETLDRSFVKGENDSEGNSRSGYAISFI